MSTCAVALLFSLALVAGEGRTDIGNRLAYLDEVCDPYYVGLDTPKLVTPQWIGEEGVEAVIVLAIDDLRDAEVLEKFVRPIADRLKKIDGRASLSMMTNRIDPGHPLVETWFREGITLEAHTDKHPCPCLQGADLAKAKGVLDRNVDFLVTVPNARPVAFRMPCCDSMNSVSPRFFTEIFGKTTPAGNFLAMDSSVFHLFTAADSELPRELVLEADGRERFRKYVPTDRVMANLIENYPYPYVIGRLAWEIAPLMPSDWDAQHLNGKRSPKTTRDLKAAVDATVAKRGVFSLCFHAHGWIGNDQVVEMIDHAVTKHRGKVRFLSFREVEERINKNLLGGQPLRAANGQDNGVRLADLNHDGYMDVVVGNEHVRQTHVWSPKTGRWTTCDFPTAIVEVDPAGNRHTSGVRFGVLRENGLASILVCNERAAGAWHFDGRKWVADASGLAGLDPEGPVFAKQSGGDRGVRLRDLDLDGVCELIVGKAKARGVFRWSAGQGRWLPAPLALPEGTSIVDAQGRDAGLRFVDVDRDGHADVVFSNAERYSVDLFTSMTEGWSRRVLSGKRGDRKPESEVPMIVRADETNNGAWFKYGRMWVQNEETGGTLPDHVDSRHLVNDFLAGEKEEPSR